MKSTVSAGARKARGHVARALPPLQPAPALIPPTESDRLAPADLWEAIAALPYVADAHAIAALATELRDRIERLKEDHGDAPLADLLRRARLRPGNVTREYWEDVSARLANHMTWLKGTLDLFVPLVTCELPGE